MSILPCTAIPLAKIHLILLTSSYVKGSVLTELWLLIINIFVLLVIVSLSIVAVYLNGVIYYY